MRLKIAFGLLLVPIWIGGCTGGSPSMVSNSKVSAGGGASNGSRTIARPGGSNGSTAISDRYADEAARIIAAVLEENDAYEKMEYLCDEIGHRLSGSVGLEQAVAWTQEAMKADGQENVHGEKVMVPKWVRGEESARLVKPREMKLHILGLGLSVGTPVEGITAPVVCVKDEGEFEAAADRMAGKIVLFNNPMPPYDPEKGAGYGTTVRFRGKGPRIAAENGAVACLVRSVTAHSLRTPHTGATNYRDAEVKIPAAAVSTEEADMIQRLSDRGREVVVTLKMDARHEGMVPSANVIGELRGSERPEEVVVIGGHLDSWDVGQGAHDDGGGCVIAMETINVLRKLGLRPRRTIRVVLWTNEENGLNGGRQYAEDHAEEMPNHVAAIESDSGVFAPKGYSVQCSDPVKQTRAAEQMRDIAGLIESIGATSIREGGSGADVSPMRSAGFVLMGFRVEGETYFNYHHTHADTLDKVVPEELSRCVASLAVVSYVLADMPGRLGE